jgi:hypothetical protein
MPKPTLNHRRRRTASLWLLALLLFRAYVPAGFMPASGIPFALELCPVGLAGMPAAHHHHAGSPEHTGSHDHGGSHADFEACPFGSAPAAGPISHYIAFQAPAPALSQPVVAFQSPCLTLRPQRSHLPRGPPSLA